MVAPITGPYTTEIGGSGSAVTYYSLQRKYRQTRPYNLASPYQRSVSSSIVRAGNPSKNARSYGTQDVLTYYDWSHLRNKAYERLKAQVADRAQLSVTLLEYSQSLSMIIKRATQLGSVARKIRRLDFVGAARELRLAAVPQGASVKKSFANNYLEYSFGWAPLIGDLGSAVNVLQNPLKNQRVKGSSKDASFSTTFNVVDYVNGYPTSGQLAERHSYEKVDVEAMGASMGMEVAVSNPNLWLANQLGFVNPMTVVWELIPFSFVVDWFVNVEQFLSSGTDFIGLTVENPWNARVLKGVYTYYKRDVYAYSLGPPTWSLYYETYEDRLVNKFAHSDRSLGLVYPTLTVAKLNLPSWRRAATAVSLLVQQMKVR